MTIAVSQHNSHVPIQNTNISNRIDITKFVGNLFILSALNCWASFGIINTDSQPWPTLLALLFLSTIWNRIILTNHIIYAGIIISFALFITIYLTNEPYHFLTIRAISGYYGLIIVYIAFLNYLYRYSFPRSIFIIMSIAWIFVGIVEVFAPNVSSLISPMRTTPERGVTSLAPEPTFFAMYLLISSWMILIFRNYKFNRFELLLHISSFFSIVFLAKSLMIVLYIIIALIIFISYSIVNFLFCRGIKFRIVRYIMPVLLATTCAGYILNENISKSRLYSVIGKLWNHSVVDMVAMDASINQRIEAPAMSIHGFISNFGIPGGLDTFVKKKEKLSVYWNNLFWYPSKSNKIMSWSGSILYELGIFGAIAVLLIFKRQKRVRHEIPENAMIACLLLSAVPFGFSLIPMLFALWYWQSSSPIPTHTKALAQGSPDVQT